MTKDTKERASFHGDGYSFVESINTLEFTELYHEFGFSEAIACDENSLSYITELTPELWLLMVDVNTLDSPGTVKRETLDWVEQQLQEAEEKGVQVLAVSHQNLLQHNSLLSFGYVMGKKNWQILRNPLIHLCGILHTIRRFAG